MAKLYKCVEDAKKKIDEVEKSLKNVEECIEVKDKEESND
jgi:translation elongation factor EF-1beta